jgi:hypothetical protein
VNPEMSRIAKAAVLDVLATLKFAEIAFGTCKQRSGGTSPHNVGETGGSSRCGAVLQGGAEDSHTVSACGWIACAGSLATSFEAFVLEEPQPIVSCVSSRVLAKNSRMKIKQNTTNDT